MICGRYYLGLDHMDEIAPIRREVFGKEQGWSDDILFDETDETAVQAVVYKDIFDVKSILRFLKALYK